MIGTIRHSKSECITKHFIAIMQVADTIFIDVSHSKLCCLNVILVISLKIQRPMDGSFYDSEDDLVFLETKIIVLLIYIADDISFFFLFV